MSRGWIDINEVENLLNMAYQDISGDNCDLDFVAGCIAEVLNMLEGEK